MARIPAETAPGLIPNGNVAVPRDVRRAVAYLRRHLARTVTLDELASVCEASPRTLSKHFVDFVGAPPLRYLKRLRLTAIREALLAGAAGTLTTIALQHGITHLGRFSIAYRRQFGESPSATQRRQRAEVRGPITITVATAPRDATADGLARRAFSLILAADPAAARHATALLDQALTIDPDDGWATALAACGHAQLRTYNSAAIPEAARSTALRLADRAARLAPDDPRVLTARATVHTMLRDFATADILITRALAMDPTSSWAWERSAWVRSGQGRFDEGCAHFARALRLDPLSRSTTNRLVGLGTAHFGAGRYRRAATWIHRAMQEQPAPWWAHRSLAPAYARIGERTAALASLTALRRHCPDITVGQVTSVLPFPPDFLERVADSLGVLGLPP